MSQDFMMDCLRFQTQLLNRLNNLEQEPVYPQGPYGTTDNVSTSKFINRLFDAWDVLEALTRFSA